MIFNDNLKFTSADTFAEECIRIVLMVENVRHDHDVKCSYRETETVRHCSGSPEWAHPPRGNRSSPETRTLNHFFFGSFHQFYPQLS